MSYVIQAVLSNSQHSEHGQITIPFPIPPEQYDQTIEMLQAMELGFSRNWDCTVDGLDSRFPMLEALQGTLVNVNQLDYLAKRLDGFSTGEDNQFKAMAHKLGLDNIKDFINLTFCCQKATVITDFSDLEQVGREHYMNLHGGCARTEELEDLDGVETAHLLISDGKGTITPYGVVYDNGMVLEQRYNGHQFPAYPYDGLLMVLEITPKRGLREGQNPEYLYLPAAAHQIERTLLRIGLDTPSEAEIRLDFDELPEKVVEALELENLSGDDLPGLNRMCQAIQPMTEADAEKLNAVLLMAEPGDIFAVCELAENLDLFDFIPDVHTPEEYGRYMIRESGHFEYDEALEGFYNYQRYGEQHIQQEGGQFNECGYMSYHGTMTLEELMREDPAEQYQREQGLQMGGQSI